MEWNLEGKRVSAFYLGREEYFCRGVVQMSRVQYGGTVAHYVTLDTPLVVFGEERPEVKLNHSDIMSVEHN